MPTMTMYVVKVIDNNDYNDYYNNYNDYNNNNDYRDSALDLDLDWGVVVYNQIVTWTAFAILAMFFTTFYCLEFAVLLSPVV